MGRARQLDRGEKAVRFINNLTHTKGPDARKPFHLRPWQEAIIRQLFGTLRPDGLRQYRTCLLMLPRKNGKSELAAAIALLGFIGDGEIGAEVYCAANDRDQASLVFNVCVGMVENDPELSAICEVVPSQKRIVHKASGSVLRAISAEAYSKHGFNASMIVYDELHAAPNRELWDVLTTSTGARAQPLVFVPTTAGYDRHSILWELYDHACKVRDGIKTDPTFLPVIYEAAKEADWTDEAVWKAANPALGDFRFLDEMQALAHRAKSIPANENAFRRLYLNQWTEQAERWISMHLWDACQQAPGLVGLEDLKGRTCYVGMDLSSTRDLTALVAVFPDEANEGIFDVLADFFIPLDSLRERNNRDRVAYDQWLKGDHVRGTVGATVDYEAVRQTLQQWAQWFDLREVAYDPWNATDLVDRIEKQDGLTCIKMHQGFAALSAPTKALEKAIVSRKLRHNGHPVLRWNVGNVAVETDPAGNLKPSKKFSTERIDGVIALVMAVDLMNRNAGSADAQQGELMVV